MTFALLISHLTPNVKLGIYIEDIGFYKFGITIAAASVAAVFAATASQPGDALLTRSNQQLKSVLSSSSDSNVESANPIGEPYLNY